MPFVQLRLVVVSISRLGCYFQGMVIWLQHLLETATGQGEVSVQKHLKTHLKTTATEMHSLCDQFKMMEVDKKHWYFKFWKTEGVVSTPAWSSWMQVIKSSFSSIPAWWWELLNGHWVQQQLWPGPSSGENESNGEDAASLSPCLSSSSPPLCWKMD